MERFVIISGCSGSGDSTLLEGMFAAITALFLAAGTTFGDPTISSIYTLNSLAAAVPGGVALTGGRGTVIGPVLGNNP
jgi:ribose transport system permease protein